MSCDVPARHIFVALIFFGMVVLTSLRTNLNISIISMVKTIDSEQTVTNNTSSDVCDGEVVYSETRNSTGTIEWSSVQQGMVLGCYFYGNIISCVLGPWVAKKVGVKLVVGISMLISAILTLLLPIAAYQGFGLFVVIRALVGFFQGPFLPTCIAAFPFWIVPKQSTLVYSISISGYCFGYFVTLNLCSIIAEYWSWQAVFYITGSLAFVWSVLWFALMYNTPGEHPRISKKEKIYLKKNIPENSQKKTTSIRVPWLKILTSLPYLAVNISHAALEWTFALSAILLPKYLATVLKMDLTVVGISSGLPFLIVIVVLLLASKVVDILRDKTKLSLTTIRKIIVLTALLGSAFSVVVAAYAGCNKVVAVVFFVLLVQFFELHATGTEANVFDLSPTHCGILLGFCLSVTGACGFVAPFVAGYILDDNNTLSGWKTFFWITAGINIFAAVFYAIFGSAEEQPWSKEAILVDTEEFIDEKHLETKNVDVMELNDDEEDNKTD